MGTQNTVLGQHLRLRPAACCGVLVPHCYIVTCTAVSGSAVLLLLPSAACCWSGMPSQVLQVTTIQATSTPEMYLAHDPQTPSPPVTSSAVCRHACGRTALR